MTDESMTDGFLFSFLRTKFGIGDYSGDESEVAYQKFRSKEIGKIKAMRKKHRVATVELYYTAEYCIRHRIVITQSWQLFRHLTMAMHEHRANERKRELAELENAVQEAIRYEHSISSEGTEWSSRLSRAEGPDRKEVLRRWRLARHIW